MPNVIGRAIGKFERVVGTGLGRCLPRQVQWALAAQLAERDPQALLEALGPRLNRDPSLATMPVDLSLQPGGALQFEHLAGLFSSTSLDHGVIAMTVRQTAYLFGLVRQMRARTVIEIGRYKGGSTLVIASAMAGQGRFWSVDNGEKEVRVHGAASPQSFDEQLARLCRQWGLQVELLVGDSRTIAIDAQDVDLVFIDGDHRYAGVKNDFERFGRRVRIGGAVLFDDAYHERLFRSHVEDVGRLVREVAAAGDFRLVKTVDRLAHLERVR